MPRAKTGQKKFPILKKTTGLCHSWSYYFTSSSKFRQQMEPVLNCFPIIIGDRQTIMWTLIGDKPLETLGIIGDITRACKFSLLFCRQSKMGKSRDRIPLIWVQSLSALHIDIHLSWCTWPIYCILFTLVLPIKCLCFGLMSGCTRMYGPKTNNLISRDNRPTKYHVILKILTNFPFLFCFAALSFLPFKWYRYWGCFCGL